jgi:hypothetical protein
MERVQSPADIPRAALEVGRNVMRFVGHQLEGGWANLPADPNGEPIGASITVYEGVEGVGIPQRSTRSRAV